MSDTPAVYVLTNSQLRTLLESARAGDSIDDAMLTAQDMSEATDKLRYPDELFEQLEQLKQEYGRGQG